MARARITHPFSLHFSSMISLARRAISPVSTDLRRRGHQIRWYPMRCTRCSSRWYSSLLVFSIVFYTRYSTEMQGVKPTRNPPHPLDGNHRGLRRVLDCHDHYSLVHFHLTLIRSDQEQTAPRW